jgi:3-deoxy-D-manno-octulosonate 8-phosphate phosphatase (KDO 8-P phosphatase)
VGASGLTLAAGIDRELQEVILRLKMVVFDFDGVFTDNYVYVFDDGREAVRCSRLDSMGLKHLRTLGIETAILSTETNEVVGKRAAKLKMLCIQGCEDKTVDLRDLVNTKGLKLQDVAFVGNDINDGGCLSTVGLPIVVADAHPDVVPLAKYQTQALGGKGAVREICDLIAKVRGIR